MINEPATKEFSITKGVCQGDPISPFLFILTLEDLNVAMQSAGQNSLFYGVKIPNGGPELSHLFYTYDTLFMGKWTSSNFSTLAPILWCFQADYGLQVNLQKSNVYGIGISDGEIASCARILGVIWPNSHFLI